MIFWDRTTLKDRAKFVLKNTYWMTFLALIVVSLLGGGSNSSSAGISAIFSSIISMMGSGAILAGSGGDRNAITAYFAVASVLILIVIAISLFAFAYNMP